MRFTVGIAEMSFSNSPSDTVVTHALGSCIGIAVYDPIAMVGGILHYMLPMSSMDAAKAEKNPLMFGDTGIPALFIKAYALGAKKENMRVVMAGGANVISGSEHFNIGQRNITIARKLFWKNGVMVAAEHVGEDFPRTLYLDMSTGHTWFTSRGVSYEL